MSFRIALAIALAPLAVVASPECAAPQECGNSLLSVSQALAVHAVSDSNSQVSAAELSLLSQLAKSHKATKDLVVSLRQVAEQVSTTGKNASIECVDAVQPIHHEMDVVKEGAVNATAIDQKRVDDSIAVVEACNTAAQTGSHTDSSSVSTARETHATCRTQEKELSQDQTTLCQDFAEYEADLTFPSCGCVPGSLTGSASAECMLSVASWSQNHNATFFHKKDACDHAAEANSAKKAICDGDQTSFEMSYCTWASHLHQADESLTTCYSTATAAHEATVADVQASTAIRRAEYDAAHQSQCLVESLTNGGALVDQPAEYESCLNTETDTSVLDITYPDVPSKVGITLAASRPCDGTWLQDEYETHPWHDATKACFACDASAQTGFTCGNVNSDDCISEHNNAGNDLGGFCNRCETEGGSQPLRNRCELCCDHCPASG